LKTLECIELIQLADEGGIFTDESRFDRGTMLTVLNAARAFAITEMYSKNTRVHPNFIQRIYPEYKEALQQDDCYNLFLSTTRWMVLCMLVVSRVMKHIGKFVHVCS